MLTRSEGDPRMFLVRKILTVAFVTTVPLVMLNVSDRASAFPAGEYPHVHCTRIAIDPAHWVKVRFVGTIGGVAFDRTVAYGADPAHPHTAWVEDSDLTTGTGPLAYDVTASSAFLGTAHSSGTITCHEAPTTTTSTSEPQTTTTTAQATTTTQAPTTTTTTTTTGPCDRFARGVAPMDTRPGGQACGTTPTTTHRIGLAITAKQRPTLPFTGSSTGPVAGFGASILAGGGLAVWKTRHRGREVKVRRKLLAR